MDIRETFFKLLMGMAPRVRGLRNKYYFSHPFLDAWFAWGMQYLKYDGAEVGEMFNVAARITERDPKSWGREWTAEGARVEHSADDLLARGHKTSAAGAFLRAYSYYRLGHVVYGPDEPEMRETFSAYRRCFAQFAALAPNPIESVTVPYDGHEMRGYFFKVADDGQQRPTVLFINGAETVAEDAYWWIGAAGVQRGYNVLAVDVPGDMATRLHTPDLLLKDATEGGLKAVVDYAISRPEVDPNRLAANGVSMGGYKVGRLAMVDNRLRGVIANAPMLDAGKVLVAMKKTPKLGKGARDWALRMAWQYGVDVSQKPQDAVNEMVDRIWGKFVVEPEQITCPFMILAGENELGKEALRQVSEFERRLGSDHKTKRLTTYAEGAESHCQLNNFGLQQQITYDWLDDLFGHTAIKKLAGAA